MEHLVYCDNAEKKGEKELDKILAGTKTMVIRGAAGRKIPHTAIENFVKLVEGKATLIKKALNADRLDIRVNDEKISLPWFNDTPDTETVQAFMQLAGCLLAKANSQQRVTLRTNRSRTRNTHSAASSCASASSATNTRQRAKRS